MDIVFAALTDADFQHYIGTASGVLPLPAGIGVESAGSYAFGTIALPTSSATGYIGLVGTSSNEIPAPLSFGTQRSGGWGVAYLPLPTSYARDASLLVPQDGFGDAELPAIESTAAGYISLWGAADGELPALQAHAFEAAGEWGVGYLPGLEAGSYEEAAIENYAIMAMTGGILFSSYGSNVAPVSDTIGASAALRSINNPHIIEEIVLRHPLVARMDMQAALSEDLGLSAGIVIVLDAIAASSIGITTPLTTVLTRLVELQETLVLSGAVATRQEATATIVEALLFEDLARSGWSVSAASSMSLGETVTMRTRAIVSALAAVNMSATAVPVLSMTALIDETIDAGTALATSAHLFAAIQDGIALTLTLRFGTDEYTAWALSMNKRASDGVLIPAVVEYRNFPFNSFVEFEGKYYGASEHGIFELTGDDDDGDPIDAWVRTALSNLGNGHLKQLPTMYLGYASTGQMVLKVITTSATGAKVEDWYVMNERPAGAMRDGRIKIGKGLKSVYWAWELHNKAGADFDLDVVELMPLVVNRRIK